MNTQESEATGAGSRLQQVLRRDRTIVILALTGVVAVATAYTIAGVGMEMSAVTMTRMAIEMPGMMMQPAQWSVGYAAAVVAMWWMMMIAMMAPSALPAISVFSAISRKQAVDRMPLLATSCFVAGYLLVWGLFSLAGAAAQWTLEKAGMMTGMMEIGTPLLAGAVLLAAGLYQLTPLKSACLRHCQHPVMFLMHHWQPGNGGALRMGWQHGVQCLGCCWLLMALLLVGGVMNLLWIAGLAIYVAFEKIAGQGRLVTKAGALVLMLSGFWMIVRALGPA